MSTPNLGRYGIWSMELRFGDRAQALEAVTELDELGYGAIWVPGGIGGDITGDLDQYLDASSRAVIATGIINIWRHEPAEIATWWKALPAERQSRLLLGIGVSHGPAVGPEYTKPLAKTRAWTEAALAEGIPADKLCIAALRDKMLALSGELTAGAHPYLIDVAHTRHAREVLGPGKLLAPEYGVILETDRARMREVAIHALSIYKPLPNYRNSWIALGYSEEEIDSRADRFLDGIFAWGTPEAIKARLDEHLAAGADHVCPQVLTGPGTTIPDLRVAWRRLAEVLF